MQTSASLGVPAPRASTVSRLREPMSQRESVPDAIPLSVVIPVHDEAGNIRPLFEEIAAALGEDAKWEVIFVDDASSDAGVQELDQLLRSEPRCRVVRMASCCGQSTAVHVGIRAARGEWIATLDGDGQNDPADIPRLMAAAAEAGDQHILVIGHRKRRSDNWLRRMSSRIANSVRSRMLRDGTPDSGCGLKLFRRDVYLRLPFFDHMHRFMPALFRRAGCAVRSAEVNHRPRQHGQSKYGIWNRLWVGIVDLFGVNWLIRRHPVAQATELHGEE